MFINRKHTLWAAFALLIAAPQIANAREVAVKMDEIAPLSVREVTIFKDGHAFVLQEGDMATDNGEIVLDDLPNPVIGTFWAYAQGAKLNSVTASRRLVGVNRTAQNIRDLLKANIGAAITVVENTQNRYDATILSVPTTQNDEAPLLSLTPLREYVPPPAEIILLQTKDGVRVVPLSSINDVIFKNTPRPTLQSDEYRNLLRLQLPGTPRRATVGFMYLQKGIRWIPSYKLALDGKGGAEVKMQATLANELIDLKNVTANLVIGVPSFAFKDVVDPIALQDTFARLSPLFESGSRSAGALSNAIQSQVTSNSYGMVPRDQGNNAGPELGEGAANEDYFLFSVKNLTLAKGERAVFPLAQYDLKYQDIYTLETPPAPPPDLYRALNYQQQNEVAQNLQKPSVMHKIRLTNSGVQPLTTAPTLIESNGRVLAQTLMTYTAPGGRSDLDLAPAVDVTVKRRENETKRTPDAVKWRDDTYERIDISGTLTVTSYRNTPITLELTRQFAGTVDAASDEGAIRKIGAGDDDNPLASRDLPAWWNYSSNGWSQLNGLGEVKWTLQVPAKKSVELTYQYHYFWR